MNTFNYYLYLSIKSLSYCELYCASLFSHLLHKSFDISIFSPFLCSLVQRPHIGHQVGVAAANIISGKSFDFPQDFSFAVYGCCSCPCNQYLIYNFCTAKIASQIAGLCSVCMHQCACLFEKSAQGYRYQITRFQIRAIGRRYCGGPPQGVSVWVV